MERIAQTVHALPSSAAYKKVLEDLVRRQDWTNLKQGVQHNRDIQSDAVYADLVAACRGQS